MWNAWHIQEFQFLVKNQSNKRTKVMRINGDNEYTSKAFKLFYGDQDKQHEVTNPYTQQHNNLDMARCMVKLKGMPTSF